MPGNLWGQAKRYSARAGGGSWVLRWALFPTVIAYSGSFEFHAVFFLQPTAQFLCKTVSSDPS